MTATKNSDTALEILCRSAIDEILQQCEPQDPAGGQDEQTL